MDEADRILIDTLISIGVDFTVEEVSLENFSPDILILATSICLEIIFESRNEPQNFPKACPAKMAARFKVGQLLSEALKSLGYKQEIGYQSFLYPNARDTRQIISFLVERLPKDVGSAIEEGGNEATRLNSIIKQSLEDNWRSPWLPYYCHQDDHTDYMLSSKYLLIDSQHDRDRMKPLKWWFDSFPPLQSQTNSLGELLVSLYEYESKSLIAEKLDIKRHKRQLSVLEKTELAVRIPPKIKKRSKFLSKEREQTQQMEQTNKDESQETADNDLEERLRSVQTSYDCTATAYNKILQKLESINLEYRSLQEAKEDLSKEVEAISREVAIKEKTGLVLQHGVDSVPLLQAAIDKRENQIDTATREWRARRAEIEAAVAEAARERGRCQSGQEELEGVRAAMEMCRREHQRREGLAAVLEDRLRQAVARTTATTGQQGRVDFTRRILELSENRRRQREEVRRVLADVCQVQREAHSLRGKLARSLLETNEAAMAHARKDEAARRICRLVVGIHENCDCLVAVIEERGRLLREIRDLETGLDGENKDNLDRNLERIAADCKEAREGCDRLRARLRSASH